MSIMGRILETATGHFFHTSGGSYFSLVVIIDDFGNVISRESADSVIGFCRFFEDNWA
jgi:hypothetical protein